MVALDLPGYGDSDGPNRSSLYDPERMVSVIQEFIVSLGESRLHEWAAYVQGRSFVGICNIYAQTTMEGDYHRGY